MKNYITNETLPDILSDLAEKFLDNGNRVHIDIELSSDPSGHPVLSIRIWEKRNDGKHLLCQKGYEIISSVSDRYDVMSDTIEEAITKLN